MDREQTKQALTAVAQHGDMMRVFANGAELETLYSTGVWVRVTQPSWDAGSQYRAKPSPKLRPYNREELNDLVGKVLVRKSDNDNFLVSHRSCTVDAILVFTNGAFCKTGELLDVFTHRDGCPCGKLEG